METYCIINCNFLIKIVTLSSHKPIFCIADLQPLQIIENFIVSTSSAHIILKHRKFAFNDFSYTNWLQLWSRSSLARRETWTRCRKSRSSVFTVKLSVALDETNIDNICVPTHKKSWATLKIRALEIFYCLSACLTSSVRGQMQSPGSW